MFHFSSSLVVRGASGIYTVRELRPVPDRIAQLPDLSAVALA